MCVLIAETPIRQAGDSGGVKPGNAPKDAGGNGGKTVSASRCRGVSQSSAASGGDGEKPPDDGGRKRKLPDDKIGDDEEENAIKAARKSKNFGARVKKSDRVAVCSGTSVDGEQSAPPMTGPEAEGIIENAEGNRKKLIPFKKLADTTLPSSAKQYLGEWSKFAKWLEPFNISLETCPSEEVFLNYFHFLKCNGDQASTMFTKYGCLNGVVKRRYSGHDLNHYRTLSAF